MTSQSKPLHRNVLRLTARGEPDAPFLECPCQQPNNDWKVLALVVSWEYHRVLVSVDNRVTALHT